MCFEVDRDYSQVTYADPINVPGDLAAGIAVTPNE